MHQFPLTILSLLLFLLFSPLSAVDDPFHAWSFGCDTNTYTPNTTFAKNLNSTLTSLFSHGSTSGYANATVGRDPNKVFGLVLCRGDINKTDCHKCLSTATSDVNINCTHTKGAVAWYDYCLIYYSQTVLSLTNNTGQLPMVNQNDATDKDRFTELVNQVLNATADYAAENSTRRFATGEVSGYTEEEPKVYGLVQCTPDMGRGQCRQCLQELFDLIPSQTFYGKIGGRVIGVRCNMRYEVYKFFEGESKVKLSAADAPAPSPAGTASTAVPPSLGSPPPPPPASMDSPAVPTASPEVSPPPAVSPPPPDSFSQAPGPAASGTSGKKNWMGIALGILIPLAFIMVI